MSEKKQNTALIFLRKNLYYLLIGIAMIIIAAVITVVMINKNSDPSANKESNKNSESVSDSDSGGQQGGDPSDPVDTKIVFVMPVENGTVLKDYTVSTVVFNKTLGIYTGHTGIDFSGAENAKVKAAYAGTIESITEEYLKGITVTIDHGNGLKTVYNSIETAENLAKGQKVAAGDVIGTISTNNRQEYKDGQHLHFEVILNNLRVDPNTYLPGTEK